MAQPSPSQVHYDPLLTNISTAYLQDASNYVASQVFPWVPVSLPAGKYNVYSKNDFRRVDVKPRANATESAGSGYSLDRASYDCDVYALHKDIGDQERASSAPPHNPDTQAAAYLGQQMALHIDDLFGDNFMSTGVWGTDKTGGGTVGSGVDFVHWGGSTGDPIGEIYSACVDMMKNTGFKPNTLVLTPDTYVALRNHDDIRERINYVAFRTLTTPDLASVFDIERVVITKASMNTAIEGQAATNNFTSGNEKALLCHTTSSPMLNTATAGYIFYWAGLIGNQMTSVKSFRIEERAADRVEIESAFDMKVVSPDLGILFTSSVA